MASSSPSRLSRAAVIMALISLVRDGASFPLSRIPLDSRPGTCPSAQSAALRSRRGSPLHSAVDTPLRPLEDEEVKESEKRKTEGDVDVGPGAWEQVVGGFVPKLLRRDGRAAASIKSPEVQMIESIQEYKRVVVDEKEQIVVVRFFAPWCRSCKRAHPLFKKMVSEHAHSRVKFVEVPLTKETAYIHEGLGVPSVPFGHIYHPDAGLVEERKINRRVFKKFRDALDCYVKGSCDLHVDEEGEDYVAEDGFQ